MTTKQQILQSLAETKTLLLDWIGQDRSRSNMLSWANELSKLQKQLAPTPEELKDQLEEQLFDTEDRDEDN